MSTISYRGSSGFSTIKVYSYDVPGYTLQASPTNDSTSIWLSELFNYDDYSALLVDIRLNNGLVADTNCRVSLVDFTTPEYVSGGQPRGQVEQILPLTLNGIAKQGRAMFALSSINFPLRNMDFFSPTLPAAYNNVADAGGVLCSTRAANLVYATGYVRFPSKFRIMISNMDTGGLNIIPILNVYIRAIR